MSEEQDEARLVHPVTLFGSDKFGGENPRAMKILPPDTKGGPKPGEDGTQPNTKPVDVGPALHAVKDDDLVPDVDPKADPGPEPAGKAKGTPAKR
jgi:hypothetical protein